MQRIFSSPHLIDLVLALTLLEAIGLLLARRQQERRRRRSGSVHPPGPNRDDGTAPAAALRPPALATPDGPNTMRPIAIVWMLLPGVCLMLAIRAALDGAAWPWVPVALAASLVVHLADLRQRWSE